MLQAPGEGPPPRETVYRIVSLSLLRFWEKISHPARHRSGSAFGIRDFVKIE